MHAPSAPTSLLPLVLLLAQAPTPSAQEPKPRLEDAQARLQANDAAGAVRILEALVREDPGNARAWRNLGQAARVQGDLERAVAAWQRALELDPSLVQPLYSLGVVEALRGHDEEALRWLAKARDTHKLDLSQIDVDPALQRLAKDPRFASLRPVAKDFADPFVEPTRIVREWDGEAAGDQFGWIARRLGDVDGDRVPDVVTSAPTHGAAGSAAGRVYVYSTRTGKLLWSADGPAGGQLGTGVECAGDTNGDGTPDVIASAPGAGLAFVYSGRDGHVLQTLRAESAGDDFGRHVAGVGDLDHDGCADVIVGAPATSAGGERPGRACVYSGKDAHVLLALDGEHAGDQFGSAVAGWSDAHESLLVVGAGRGGARHAGRVCVYDGRAKEPRFTIDADETGAALGTMFVSIAGDVDGDGFPDVYVSDWQNAALGPATGRVYVHSGKDGRRLHVFTGEGPSEGFGTSSAVAGDVDGDGRADLLVGAWQFGAAAVGAGRATLRSGADGHVLGTWTCRTPGDAFGFDAVALGDVDGDGTIELLITSGWSAVKGYHSGRVFVVSSGLPARKH